MEIVPEEGDKSPAINFIKVVFPLPLGPRSPNQKLKTFSKGTKEKVHLILAMSRRAKLYLLDEPIAGVDLAARDYILKNILSNYDENASILISTHLI